MPNYIDISRNQLNKLIKELNVDVTLSSGASLAHPGLYPSVFKEIGINQRDEKRNKLIGTVTSKLPDVGNVFMVGVSYKDNKDNTPNEDFFEVQTDLEKVGKYKPSEFEKKFPEYKGMHRDIKDFFYEQ